MRKFKEFLITLAAGLGFFFCVLAFFGGVTWVCHLVGWC